MAELLSCKTVGIIDWLEQAMMPRVGFCVLRVGVIALV